METSDCFKGFLFHEQSPASAQSYEEKSPLIFQNKAGSKPFLEVNVLPNLHYSIKLALNKEFDRYPELQSQPEPPSFAGGDSLKLYRIHSPEELRMAVKVTPPCT